MWVVAGVITGLFIYFIAWAIMRWDVANHNGPLRQYEKDCL